MRIAIPIKDGRIAPHLGHCHHFLVADIADGRVTARSEHANPGHGPGGPPPVFVRGLGATHVLAWGMPPHAQGLFRDFGIAVQLGATGDPEQALGHYLAGTLTLTTEGLDAGGSCEDTHHGHDDHH